MFNVEEESIKNKLNKVKQLINLEPIDSAIILLETMDELLQEIVKASPEDFLEIQKICKMIIEFEVFTIEEFGIFVSKYKK